jgi:hypothetical protein
MPLMPSIRFGSEADVRLANVHVRFVPFSGLIGRGVLISAKCH